jgi:hypothetical protein
MHTGTSDFNSAGQGRVAIPCLMRDEPERGLGFSRKMSLKGGGIEMLRIDHQHGRFRSHEPGTDPGVSGRQRRNAFCRARTPRGVPLGGTNVGAPPICEPQAPGERAGAALPCPDHGPEPRYRLRNSLAYRKRNATYQPPSPPLPIGERRKTPTVRHSRISAHRHRASAVLTGSTSIPTSTCIVLAPCPP